MTQKTGHRFLDSRLGLEERARDLLSQLTLEEKCSQLTYESPAIDRLGIPAYNWWNECLHGVGRAGLATVFPQAIGLAASFNTELVHRVATAISDEARAKHHAHAERGDFGIYKGLTFWTPNINIFRDPRWGRGHETYGECPFLTSEIGVAFVKGLQGDDERHLKVVATPKHFAVHSGPEKGRHGFDVHVSQRDLHETYLPAFRATVMEGGAFSVMGAYNRLDGVPCCGSALLLEKILRQDWGFKGYTVSDCGAISDFHEHHGVTKGPAESAAMAINNGLDLCCGSDYANLQAAVVAGLVSEETVDRSLLRLLIARLRLGMFDPKENVRYARIAYSVVDSPEHRELALEAARRSIVLLKNDGGLLPLSNKVKSIAVIGPNADARQVLLGNYHGTPPYVISPVEGIRERAGEAVKISYVQGCTHLMSEGPWLGNARRGFVEAILAAEQADLSIVCLGLTPTIEGEEGDAMNSDAGGDRTAIELPGLQEELLKRIVAVGKPVVLVLIGGSAMAVPWAQEHVSAIVQQFYPGQDGGTALAEVLFGDHNPSGRLPITVYRATGDLPPFENYSMANRTYRFFEGDALYPFGFGRSFTRFAYSDLKLSASEMAEGDEVALSALVKNVGERGGDEIVQVYLERSSGVRRQLIGMKSVFLKVGEARRVEFVLKSDRFLTVNEAGKHVMKDETVGLTVGGSQPGERSQALGAPEILRISVHTRGEVW